MLDECHGRTRNEAKRRDIHKSHLFFFFFFGSLFKKWFGFLAQMKSYLEPSLSPPFPRWEFRQQEWFLSPSPPHLRSP